MLQVEPVTPLPERLAVGGGTALFVDGRCRVPDGERIAALEVVADGVAADALGWGLAPPRMHGDDYWWAILPIAATAAPREVELRLHARLASGETLEARIGTLALVPELQRADGTTARPESGAGPTVAICMATYEPPPAMFEEQLESIRAQTHTNWICLISDDGSGPASRAMIERAVAGDPRFELSFAPANAGFYANFERALAMVPPGTDFVALCDQDDRWRADKLERLLQALGPKGEGPVLSFSDMRVTTRSGQLLADTYWQFRPVNYTDFGSEVLANTITGAASVFDAALLDDVLPFPPRHGNAFHDHWIGQVAMALGDVAYVPEPLYDYVQHDDAALGFLEANGAGRFSGPPWERATTWYRRWSGRGYRLAWRVPYFKLYCRVRVATTAMRLRLAGRLTPDRLEVLDAIADDPAGIAWLGRRALRDLRGPTATIGRERVMLAGLAWKRAAIARRRVSRARGAAARAVSRRASR
jgi:glycosyltransferase involved in cell wall biosynthesis